MPSRSPAGIRTFTVASLAGATSFIVGGEVLLAVATTGVIILTAVAYWRAHENDPGLTTEIALILTTLLGGLSMQQPALAAGLAVTVACMLTRPNSAPPLRPFGAHRGRTPTCLDFRRCDTCRPAARSGSSNWTIRRVKSALNLDSCMNTRHGNQRCGLRRSPHAWRPVRTSHRRSSIRLHLKHRDYRGNGCAGCEDEGRSRGRSCGCSVVNDCDDRPDGICSCRHQYDNPSNPVCASDLRRRGRRPLWNCFYDPRSAAED